MSIVYRRKNIENKSSDRHLENKLCTILWNRGHCGLTILNIGNFITHNIYPEFLIPLETFLNCGSIWSVMKLSTIFWDRTLASQTIKNDENERIKAAYLTAFISDKIPKCKEWVEKCIEKIIKNETLKEDVFVNIIIFDQTLLTQMINAIDRHGLTYSLNKNVYTIL
jgi:hypothetical protein